MSRHPDEPADEPDGDPTGARLDERFADWVDGRLSPAERVAFEAQMARDPELRRAGDEYRQRVQMLRSALAPEDMGPSLADAVMARVRPAAVRPPRAWRPYLASLVAAAALVLVFFVLRSIPPAGEVTRQDVAAGAPESALRSGSERLDELAQVGRAVDEGMRAARPQNEQGPANGRALAHEPAPAPALTEPSRDADDARFKDVGRLAKKSGAATEAKRERQAADEVATEGGDRALLAVTVEKPVEEALPRLEGPGTEFEHQPQAKPKGEGAPPALDPTQAPTGVVLLDKQPVQDHLQESESEPSRVRGRAEQPALRLEAAPHGSLALVVEGAPADARVWSEIDARKPQADGNTDGNTDGNVAELLAVLAPPLESVSDAKQTTDFRRLSATRVPLTDLSLGDFEAPADGAKEVEGAAGVPQGTYGARFALTATDRVYRVRGTQAQLLGLVDALRARVRGEVRFERVSLASAGQIEGQFGWLFDNPSPPGTVPQEVGDVGSKVAGPGGPPTPTAPSSPGPASGASAVGSPTSGPTAPGAAAPGSAMARRVAGAGGRAARPDERPAEQPPVARGGRGDSPTGGGGGGGSAPTPGAPETYELILVLRPARR